MTQLLLGRRQLFRRLRAPGSDHGQRGESIWNDPRRGNSSGDGVFFKLTNTGCTEGGTQTFWCESLKHTFAGGADGSGPNGDLGMDGSGNIFGTTAADGNSSLAGVIWKQSGSTHSTLYRFCPSDCADGEHPESGVILDSLGNLYGTTELGGANSEGVIHEYTP